MSNNRKPTFAVGKVSAQNGGMNDVSIGGSEYSIRNVPADGSFYAPNEQVLVCYINDDSPVIIGKPGYKTGTGLSQ